MFVWLPLFAIELPAQQSRFSPTADVPQSTEAADQSPPTTEQVQTWIGQLEHDSYSVRQAAASELLSAGIAARELLQEVADGPNPEIRAAASRLLVLIGQSEFTQRLAAFAADTDGKQGVTMPGWKEFSALVGGNRQARELFVEMQRHERALLADQFSSSSQPSAKQWEARLQRLSQWRPTADGRRAEPPLGSCATVFFLSLTTKTAASHQAAVNLVELVKRPPLLLAVQGPNAREPIRRLVVRWVIECPDRGEAVLQQRLILAQLLELREAVPLALGIATNDPAFLTTSPGTRVNAISLVGQLGNREDAERLEPLLDEDAVYIQSQQPVAFQVQVRDIALIMMLQLTDQSPAEYGYTHAQMQPQGRYALPTLYPDSDETRTNAAAKWREWKAAQQRDLNAKARNANAAGS